MRVVRASTPFYWCDDEHAFEARERMTYGGVEVEFTKRVDSLLKEIWVDAISECINATS